MKISGPRPIGFDPWIPGYDRDSRSENNSVIELYFDSNLEMLEFTAGGGGDGGEDEFKPKYFLFENAFRNQSEVMRHLIK